MRHGAVVTLEEVLGRDLPVRRDLPVDAVVERETVDVDATLGKHRRHLAENLLERRRLAVEVDEPERAPALEADLEEPELLVALELLGSGAERSGRRARTSRRGTRTGATSTRGLLDHDRSAMPADVDEGALGSILRADRDHRYAAGPPRDDVVLPRTPTYCQLRRKIATSSRSSTAGRGTRPTGGGERHSACGS